MALSQVQPSASLSVSSRHACVFTTRKYPASASASASARFPQPTLIPARASFITGSPLCKKTSPPSYHFQLGNVIQRTHGRKSTCKAMPVSIRCEQSTKEGSGLDVWLGRIAMIGFAVALTVEISTGKGLLENFGLNGPLPTVALAVTALVGVLTAVFIFQSASKN